MSARTTLILQQAMTLTDEERAELACSLLNSLDREVDADAETCWEREISNRIAELDAGEVKTVPWQEVRSKTSATLQHGHKKARYFGTIERRGG